MHDEPPVPDDGTSPGRAPQPPPFWTTPPGGSTAGADAAAGPAVTRPMRQRPTRPLPTAPPPGAAVTRSRAARARTAAAGTRDCMITAGSRVARVPTAVAQAGRATVRGIRALTHAGGAGESGLGRVMELHLVSTAADTLIVTALATTIFFAVPTEQARGRVATSLLVTMVPFVVLAPLIGPLLDRLRRGRRYALATTMVVRAFLAWVMAGAVGGAGSSHAAFSLYPAAFGFLVCQKAYIVTRAAALPRVLPHATGLVAANSRISLAGVAAMTLAAPLGTGLNGWFGPTWTLRLAFVIFAVGTAVALALPPVVDSSEGELPARITGRADRGHRATGAGGAQAGPWRIGSRVILGLRANSALRAFTGFLTLFLAFRLRHAPLGGLEPTTAVALVIVLAAVGGGAGTGLGGALRRVRPETVVAVVVCGTALAAVWSALGYGLWPVLAVAFVAGFGQALGKLCLDALIQRDVPEHVRTSAFARSETILQLAWVLGGGVGLALPLSGAWGLGVAAVAMLAAALFVVASLTRLGKEPAGHPARAPGARPAPGRRPGRP